MSSEERIEAAVLGALVADAASMGLHWLYDRPRLQEVGGDEPEFQEPKEASFEGVSSYFAHAGKEAGESSHYGAQLSVLLSSVSGKKFSLLAYQQSFRSYFSASGAYVGYVDSPMRMTLQRMAEADEEDSLDLAHCVYGAVDEQLPALTKVAPMLWGEAMVHLPLAVRVTNDHPVALACAVWMGEYLERLCQSGDWGDWDLLPLEGLPEDLITSVQRALSLASHRDEEACEAWGTACHLAQGIPLVLYLLRTSRSFVEAVRRNILCGGDSCGRAVMLGALAGAVYGLGDEQGIPQLWLDRTRAVPKAQRVFATAGYTA